MQLKESNQQKMITEMIYPDNFVKHPNIGHDKMVDKIFPYMKPERISFQEYLNYYQATYIVLANNFDEYLAYLEEQHWNNLKAKLNKPRTSGI